MSRAKNGVDVFTVCRVALQRIQPLAETGDMVARLFDEA